MTKVPKQAAWEYCVYAGDNDYGFYDQNNSKVSKPFGMLVVKTPGPSGIIKVKISKSLINNPDAIRYTIATFAPSQPPNRDTLFQGGSSAVDVFPGTRETFGGEINGYGESTPLGDGMTSDYTVYYLYSGINPIAEYAPNGSILARYIYAGGRHIAKVAGADTHWYHCDALGSPRKMTDERGSTVWSATYYPFGEMTAGSNNTHGFTGKEFDSEMGLNYFCQRYYDPEIGRFMTRDLIQIPGMNPYMYCYNCPLRYRDPTGLYSERDLYAVGVGIGVSALLIKTGWIGLAAGGLAGLEAGRYWDWNMSPAGPSLDWSLQTSGEYMLGGDPPQEAPTVDTQNPLTWTTSETLNQLKALDRALSENLRALWDKLMQLERDFWKNLNKKKHRRGTSRPRRSRNKFPVPFYDKRIPDEGGGHGFGDALWFPMDYEEWINEYWIDDDPPYIPPSDEIVGPGGW